MLSIAIQTNTPPMRSLYAFLITLGLLYSSQAFTQFSKSMPNKKPNIIFILVDDMGWGDLGVFWQKQRMKNNDRTEPWQFTPSLDKMAANGVMLTNHYCAAPVCAPSRASILLGVSQGHSNVRNNQFDKALQDTYTMGGVLKQAGYNTTMIGKWGLQGLTPDWPAHPLNRGFDYSYAYMRHVDGHEHYPKEQVFIERAKKEVWENRTNIIDGLDKCFTTDLWTAKAKQQIIAQAKQNRPFFMYLAYDVPHAVLELPTQAYPKGRGLSGGLQWLGKQGHMINTASGLPDSYTHPDYAHATWDHDNNKETPEVAWPDTYKRYATLCRRIDDGIGDILQTLKDLKIDDHTMVVFTSDNGPSIESYLPPNYAPYEPTFFNSFGPFNGIKRDVWEGGVRMPTIVQWTGKIPANSIIDQPSISYDWLPTFAAAANLPIPARADGVSLLPALTRKGKQAESLVYIEYENNGKTPDFNEFAPAHRGRVRNEMQKMRIGNLVGVRYNIQSAEDSFEVYNVATDPQERNDLATQEAYKNMQQVFKERVLQSRMPDSNAIRPYDKALVPSTAQDGAKPGVQWKSYSGNFPWVSRVEGLTATASGISPVLNSDADVKAGIFYQEGFIKVPANGTYTFIVTGEDGFLLRLHNAMVVDGSYAGHAGNEVSGSIRLQAGFHSFKLYYRQPLTGKLSCKLTWSKDGETAHPIDAAYLFH